MRDSREPTEETVTASDPDVPANGVRSTRRGGKRGGYSNVGLCDDEPSASCATTTSGMMIGGSAPTDSDEGLVAAAITTTSAAAGASKRKHKLSYVELGEGDSTPDTSVDSSSSSSGGGGGGGVSAGATEPEDKMSGRLAIFGLLNLGYVVLQLAGAMAFGSLALMSDGFHNLSDVAAIGMAMYIHRLQRRPCPENEDGGTDRLPFGYKRSEVIGGLMNSVALIALSAYIILSAIPRLIVPQEVTDGWLYISLAFGGVVINLVGVLFFWFPGEDGQSNDTHCGGFLAAHSHSHDHGHEAPVKLDSVGLLTLVDRYDVPPTAGSSSACGDDDGEEVSVILAGSDPIGRVSLNNTAVAREALLSGNGGSGGEGGHACSHSHGGHHHHANGHQPHANGHNHHANGHHQHANGHLHHANGHRDEEGPGNGHGDTCCSHGGQNGGSHAHANGHGDNDGLEIKKVHGKHGAAAVGGGCSGESHGHEHHVHGHHHDDVDSGDGDGCSHSHGHADGGGGGGCKGHGQSMNLMAVLVHAIADAVSSGVVCAQGVVAFSFGRSGVDWTDYLDPLTSIALSVFIVYCALPVVKECAHVLLEGTPRSADLPRLRKELLKVPGISKIQSLSVTQLNSEEPFVAAVTVVADPEVGGALTTTAEALENGGLGGAQTRRGGATGVVEAVKLVLGSHNIGRNTVEVVLRHGDDAARGGATEGALPNGYRETGRQSSGVETDGGGHEAERGAGGSCNGSAGLEYDRRSHGQCSGHGHSHAHSSRAVDMV
ncbi:unnamed protein product [Ectocarpus sp. 12 AP-2014]